jgi:drug/metabolite transporter (DMT)-like permease
MWVLLALLTAVCTALRDAASKHATRGADPLIIAFALAAVPAVTLGSLVALGGAPEPGPRFGIALAVSGGINVVATPLIVWALERSDLSLVAPLRSLTPVFMLVTAGLVLGEAPSAVGAAGVAVVVAGAYLLNVRDRTAGRLEPLLALARDPGARAMLLVAFLYSVSATFDKVGTQASSPLVWAAAVHVVVALALAPVAAWRWRAGRRRGPAGGLAAGPRSRGPGPVAAMLLAGALVAVGAVAQMTALTLTLAAYVIAVKRTSTLFGVLLGHLLFRERDVRQRIVGAGVMLAGFVLLTLT